MGNELAARLNVGEKEYTYYPVSTVEGYEKLPLALTVLLENVLRCAKTTQEAQLFATRIVRAGLQGEIGEEIEFSPARVLFQDFTGVPVFVDFAAMREACVALGADPRRINPQVPCDLVIDHSIIADTAGCAGCMDENMRLEFSRNAERYKFLKWAQASFENVRIVPPGSGICHQLNIEQFAHVVTGAETDTSSAPTVYFDTLVGTDSHTPTANGIGVLGWGVGGIEAEAAALGQAITTLVPRVVGVHLTGRLKDGVAAMDVALTFASMLRSQDVVGCFVECFGEGVANLTATQRTCISNMTPEYGCTCTLFPVDENTLDYLRLTGRSDEQLVLVEAYAKAQGFWNDSMLMRHGRIYADVLELDLSSVVPSVAGPSRPHDRVDLASAQEHFHTVCKERALDMTVRVDVEIAGERHKLTHGALAIAAVTSCTTATDPEMMLACGLLARNACRRGLRTRPWVKTILAPGSRATYLLLECAGLLEPLQKLGFFTCGFGCMSCIGNSGPILKEMQVAATKIELAAVLSGNRNFEGRISPDVAQNYLTAPADVVAYALAGTMDIDLARDALGTDAAGNPVYWADIAPDAQEVAELVRSYVTTDLFAQGTQGRYEGDAAWQALEVTSSDVFTWDEASTYVRRAPYFDGMTRQAQPLAAIKDAAVLGYFEDFITTDHISPAGSIAASSPAGRYLRERGIAEKDFNTYGARRGNHEVMVRGTFANVKLQNKLAAQRLGGWTLNVLSGKEDTVFAVAESYANAGIPQVVLAGRMYGSGSSRDWAAKGPLLLGVRAVIAESFERIHRSNLIGMGILPLQFEEGQSAQSVGLDGTERISIDALDFSDGLPKPRKVAVRARRADGSCVTFDATVRIDTPTEGRYYENGGILPYVLRGLVQ